MADTTPGQVPADPAQRFTVSSGKAAGDLGISRSTLWRWGNLGLIEYRETHGGHRRYRPADVANLLRLPPDVASTSR
jgi:hypothetical protein